jgi:hypothetical protein
MGTGGEAQMLASFGNTEVELEMEEEGCEALRKLLYL